MGLECLCRFHQVSACLMLILFSLLCGSFVWVHFLACSFPLILIGSVLSICCYWDVKAVWSSGEATIADHYAFKQDDTSRIFHLSSYLIGGKTGAFWSIVPEGRLNTWDTKETWTWYRNQTASVRTSDLEIWVGNMEFRNWYWPIIPISNILLRHWIVTWDYSSSYY
jgi:hypothetical protein